MTRLKVVLVMAVSVALIDTTRAEDWSICRNPNAVKCKVQKTSDDCGAGWNKMPEKYPSKADACNAATHQDRKGIDCVVPPNSVVGCTSPKKNN